MTARHSDYDVVVVGGGPAGSTTSALLAQAGRRVLVLERERFPRYHIGESLLSATLPILAHVGVLDEIERHGFVKKPGGTFLWGSSKDPWTFWFREDPGGYPHAFHVLRSEFDAILLRHSSRQGAEVLEGTAVEEITGLGPFRVQARTADGGVRVVEAGQHAGNLPSVLLSLAHRHERAGDLSHKLLGVLAYPFLVLIVGLGVMVFLSVRTLPQLCKILRDSKIAIPGLTTKVMWLGQAIAHYWAALGFGVLMLLAICMVLPRIDLPWLGVSARLGRLRPRVLRTLAVGNLAQGLAKLIRSGVPMLDSLRVIAPTAPGDLRRQLQMAADAVERGEELSQALSDQHWFDSEFRRLLDIGQASGELDTLLERIGQRYQRQTKRLIDRLAAMLEPVVILSLAVLVGTVVMAAILPLLRLQEILR
jgi:hypothetical protein